MAGENIKTFNYDSIPLGFYDEILEGKNGMRKFWHWHKFDSVKRLLTIEKSNKLLDVGCFAGTFMGKFLKGIFFKKVGVDILNEQIKFAQKKYGDNETTFIAIDSFDDLTIKLTEKFSIVTFIEVIEHLNHQQIRNFFKNIEKISDVNSELIITTPNYLSIWPLLEFLVNKISKIKYEEQHITKFNYFNLEKKLEKIVPDFHKKYKIKLKTTSHFLSPFISLLSYDFATKLSHFKKVSTWKNPFGAMILLKLERINLD